MNNKNNVIMLPYLSDGRFGNCIEYAFLAYVYQKLYNKNFKFYSYNNYDFSKYNLDNYIIFNKDIYNEQYLKTISTYNSYFTMYKDYEKYVKDFFSVTFLKNKEIENLNIIDNKILINIRLGDYLTKKIYIDRYGICKYHNYLNNALQFFKNKFQFINDLDIVSDDINMCKLIFNKKFLKYYKNINYLTFNTIYDSLNNMSMYKYKIITCSSFSIIPAIITKCKINDSFVCQIDIQTVKNEEPLSFIDILL